MKQIKFILAALAAMVFQTGDCMENWYGNALSLAFKGKAAQAVQIVHDNDKEAIKVTDPELVPEEIHDIVEEISQFIAIDRTENSNKAIYSIDGLTWNETTLPAATEDKSYWQSICCGNGTFVAVGHTEEETPEWQTIYRARIAYSTDGKTWSSVSNLPDIQGFIRSVCYAKDKFFAINAAGEVACSSDGISWNAAGRIDESTDGWSSICYGKDSFVVVHSSSDVVAYSTDGEEWEISHLPFNGEPPSVCYAKDKFVAVGSGIAAIAYSDDGGKTWKDEGEKEFMTDNFASVCYGNGKFVAVSKSDAADEWVGGAVSSTDGINWNKIANFPHEGEWYSVCYGKGKFVAMSNGGKITWSADGANWSAPQGLPDTLSEPFIYCKSK